MTQVPDVKEMTRDELEHWVMRLSGMFDSEREHSNRLKERCQSLNSELQMIHCPPNPI
jgi:hypothetical protein